MKRPLKLSVLFAGVFLLLAGPLWAALEPGDVDGDGKVTLRDVVMVLRLEEWSK